MTLRPYQEAARQAVYEHLRERDDNPCVVIPTGGGKTPLMAAICRDAVQLWQGRVLIVAHVKELLAQSASKLTEMCPEVEFGVYSAGLRRRDTRQSVILAGIQSVFGRACELDAFDLILVDEAHLIPLDGDGMYRQFLQDAIVVNPRVRVVGFTATPFRMKTGSICTPDGFLNHICYEIGVRELMRDGYLCPLVTKAGRTKVDTSGLQVRGGEFIDAQVEALMDRESLIRSACAEIVALNAERRACLIFASGVQHGRHLVETLQRDHGLECGFVCRETGVSERDKTLNRFRAGGLKYLCNVNVLTTGFDATCIDCVAIVRPTMSPGLYSQMVGRGFRLHPGKHDCLVLDFGGNVLRHGPVDALHFQDKRQGHGPAPAKECANCGAVVAAGYSCCPVCGHPFPPPERQPHDAEASDAHVLSGAVTQTRYAVRDVRYSEHIKRNAGVEVSRSLRVDYEVGELRPKSEWVCFEHQGFARQKAVTWWRRRSPDPVPDTVERALEIIAGGGVATTSAIVVRSIAGDPFESVVAHELGPIPEALPVIFRDSVPSEETPF